MPEKFRGKQLGNGEWVHGSLIALDDNYYFIVPKFEGASTTGCKQIISATMNAVDPETVGQFAGFRDKSGVEIYEGDKWAFKSTLYTIEWLDKYSRFAPRTENGFIASWCDTTAAMGTVIGNIYEE